jgi:hypothetical protein
MLSIGYPDFAPHFQSGSLLSDLRFPLRSAFQCLHLALNQFYWTTDLVSSPDPGPMFRPWLRLNLMPDHYRYFLQVSRFFLIIWSFPLINFWSYFSLPSSFCFSLCVQTSLLFILLPRLRVLTLSLPPLSLHQDALEFVLRSRLRYLEKNLIFVSV